MQPADVNPCDKILRRSQPPQLRSSELPTDFKLDAEIPCKLQTKLHFQVLSALANNFMLLLSLGGLSWEVTKWRGKPFPASSERSEQPGARMETTVPAGTATQLHCAELCFPGQSMARAP